VSAIELFRRLKPLYGLQIDRLWIEYQLADAHRKHEIEELLTILAIKRLGSMIGEPRLVLDAPPPGLIAQGEFTIGNVTYPGLPPYPFRVARDELLRHIYILGQTGTGKSTLLINLLLQLLTARVPFIAFDFKRNYRCLLDEQLLVLTVGQATAPLRINVLTPPRGIAGEEWIQALTDIISTTYLLMQGAKNVLAGALHRARKRPNSTLRDALDEIRVDLARARPGTRRYGWLESTARSLEELTNGEFGNALNANDPMPLTELLHHAVVCELHTLGEEQKRFTCLYFLHAIFHIRKASDDKREQLHHALIFDEAHNVFPREPPGELSIPARLAREIREYGEAIITASQQADISESVLANTGIKIILRCDYPKDVFFASNLLHIEPQWIPKLALGTGIARLPLRYLAPFQFTFNTTRQKNRVTTDKAVAARYTQYFRPRDTSLAVVCERQHMLLNDINDHPTSTTTSRYQRLGWHPQTGNRIKDQLLRTKLVTVNHVNTGNARATILTLTKQALAHLATHGANIQRERHGGTTHEWWKHQLKTLLESAGFTVTIEAPLGGGRTADICATNNTLALYVEVETGKSDIAANLAKYAADERLIVFLADQRLMQLAPLLATERPSTLIINPRTLHHLTALLDRMR
jgi:hypothetical protein